MSVTPQRWTGSPNKSIHQIGKNCPKNVRKLGFQPLPKGPVGESLRGNSIGATGLRASERKSASERVSERVSEREGFQRFLRGFERFSEVFRGCERFLEFFERFSEIFERFSEVLSETLSEADFLSEAFSPVAPNRVAP